MTTDNRQYVAAPVQVLLGHKLGVIQVQDADGRLVSPAVVQIGTNVVTQVRTEEVDRCSAIQLGFGEIPAHKVTKPMVGYFAKTGVEPRRHLTEVRTSAADNCEFGQEPQITMFETGRTADVFGNIKGKGLAGVMKRYGFAGVSTSHSARRNHHKPGSIGACATPGRIFKDLHMAGHMGNVRHIVQNLRIQVMDAKKSLLSISGAILGSKNGVVLVHSSVKGA